MQKHAKRPSLQGWNSPCMVPQVLTNWFRGQPPLAWHWGEAECFERSGSIQLFCVWQWTPNYTKRNQKKGDSPAPVDPSDIVHWFHIPGAPAAVHSTTTTNNNNQLTTILHKQYFHGGKKKKKQQKTKNKKNNRQTFQRTPSRPQMACHGRNRTVHVRYARCTLHVVIFESPHL